MPLLDALLTQSWRLLLGIHILQKDKFSSIVWFFSSPPESVSRQSVAIIFSRHFRPVCSLWFGVQKYNMEKKHEIPKDQCSSTVDTTKNIYKKSGPDLQLKPSAIRCDRVHLLRCPSLKFMFVIFIIISTWALLSVSALFFLANSILLKKRHVLNILVLALLFLQKNGLWIASSIDVSCWFYIYIIFIYIYTHMFTPLHRL